MRIEFQEEPGQVLIDVYLMPYFKIEFVVDLVDGEPNWDSLIYWGTRIETRMYGEHLVFDNENGQKLHKGALFSHIIANYVARERSNSGV